MKKKVELGNGWRFAALAVAFVSIQGALTAQTVEIPDPALEAAIRRELQKPEGYITVEDMESLSVFGYSSFMGMSEAISDLTGLESASNLTELGITFGEVSDLTPLTGLTSLTSLDLAFNQISDLSPLSGLTSLTELNLGDNNVSDLSPLAGLTSLVWIGLYWMDISDLGPLAGLNNLTGLDLEGNNISDLSPLTGLTNLKGLELRGNNISDLSPLSDLTNLTGLSLGDNQISDFSPLAGLTNLDDADPIVRGSGFRCPCVDGLGLAHNNISDLSPLSDLASLTSLDFSFNQISDLSPLAGLTITNDADPIVWTLANNYIDITPGSSALQIIEGLNAIEGLTVEFEPQIDPWLGGETYVAREGWFESSWFSYYYPMDPWIYHIYHGFLYRYPESTNKGMYFYDDALATWLWTSETDYPRIYAYDLPSDNNGRDVDSCWLYYFQGTRRMFRVETGPDAGLFLLFSP